MADQVEVQFTAQTAPLVAGLQSAGQAIQQTAAQMQASAASGASQMAAGLNSITTAATQTASATQTSTAAIVAHTSSVHSAHNAHAGLAGAVGLSRMQMMELGHSVRSVVDALAAGMPPTRAFSMELPRVAQVLLQLGPAAMAAGVAITAVAGAAFFAIAHFVELRSAVRGLEDEYYAMGTAAGASAANMTTFYENLGKEFRTSAHSALTVGQALASIPGASVQTQQALARVVEEMAGIRNQDPTKVAESLAKAFSSGNSLVTFAKNLNLMTVEEREHLKVLTESNQTEQARAQVIQALTDRFGGYAKELQHAKENMAALKYQMAGLTPPKELNLKPFDTKPDRDFRGPASAMQDTGEAQRQANEEAYLRVLRERQAVDVQIRDIETQLGNAQKNSDQEGIAAAKEALANAQLRRQQLVDPAQAQQLEIQLSLLREQAAASAQGSQQRVDAAQKEADLTKSVYGENSRQYAESQVKIVQAKREAAAEQLRIELDRIRGEEALARDDYGRKVQLQNQILEALRAAGKQDTAEYQAEVSKRDQLAQQGADQSFNQKQDELKREIDAERTSTQQKLSLLAQYVQNAAQYYGTASQKYQEAKNFELQVTRQVEEQKRQEQERTIESKIRGEEQSYSSSIRLLQQQRELGLLTASQELAREKQLADQEYQIELNLLQQKRALAGMSEADKQAVDNQIENLEQQHAQKMQELQFQGALQISQTYTSMFQAITNGFRTGFSGLLNGTETFAQAMRHVGDSILSSFLNIILDIGAKWVEHQIAMLVATQTTEATKTGIVTAATAARNAAIASATIAQQAVEIPMALGNIETQASEAAAGAYAATAAIPIVGPELAPAAAAEAYAAVSAFSAGVVASAAGGWAKVPMDGVLSELHRDEMVLPASIASPLRSAISGWTAPAMPPVGSGVTSTSMSSGGDANLTYAPTLSTSGSGPMTRRQAEQFFSRHGDVMLDFLKNAQRNGRIPRTF